MCVVLPSVYRTDEGYETLVPELLGQTLLEGMACGTPAICTDVASMPEVVDHGVTGFVVPPNDPAGLGERLSWLRAQSDRGLDHGSGRSSACARPLHVGQRRQPLSRRVQRDAVARAGAVACGRGRERSRMTILERVIAAGRPLQIKGKGALLNPLTPRSGSREAIVAGQYTMTLDLSNAIHRQIFMGCFARQMTRWARAFLPTGGTFLDVGAHAGLLLTARVRSRRTHRARLRDRAEPADVCDASRAPLAESRQQRARDSCAGWPTRRARLRCTCRRRVSTTTPRSCPAPTGRAWRFRRGRSTSACGRGGSIASIS